MGIVLPEYPKVDLVNNSGMLNVYDVVPRVRRSLTSTTLFLKSGG